MPGSLGEVSVDDEDDKHNNSNTKKKKKKKKNRKDERLEKEKQLLMPSSSKPIKRLNFRITKKPISPMVSSSSSGLLKACCFCGIKPPETKESTSPVSDPNDENFRHEMMRALLETDDFCSKDCNPHL